jgi:hypothetical protein
MSQRNNMTTISLKTLSISIKAVQCEIQRLQTDYHDDPNDKNAMYVLLDLEDHQRAANELKELYIEMQHGIINYPTYDDLIKNKFKLPDKSQKRQK